MESTTKFLVVGRSVGPGKLTFPEDFTFVSIHDNQ